MTAFAIDTNILVYAHLAAFPQHDRVRRALTERLTAPDAVAVVTPGVLHELVHVITDARRFDVPVPMAEATALARQYLGRSNVYCFPPSAPVLELAFDLVDRHRLGRRRLADTILAATLLHHQVGTLLTSNLRDFQVFEGLDLVDPSI